MASNRVTFFTKSHVYFFAWLKIDLAELIFKARQSHSAAAFGERLEDKIATFKAGKVL